MSCAATSWAGIITATENNAALPKCRIIFNPHFFDRFIITTPLNATLDVGQPLAADFRSEIVTALVQLPPYAQPIRCHGYSCPVVLTSFP